MHQSSPLRFENHSSEFHKELRKRVEHYFKSQNLSKYGNQSLRIKTIVFLLLYFIPYLLILFGVADHRFTLWIFTILMGTAMAGIGMGVMHDAAHGAFSRNKKINDLLSYTINLLGGHAMNWKIQHNVLHHTYTNVHEHDEDIAPPAFLRFEPHSRLRFIHKFQFLYAWFFYGLMTLMWVTTKDFRQIYRYHKLGYLKIAKTSLRKELLKIILSKMIYYSYMLLPLWFNPNLKFSEWLIGFFSLHFTASLILSSVFQPAHVVPDTDFPTVAPRDMLPGDWASHQLKTTMNFSIRNSFFTWCVGGLNFQIEHHLFPNISHVHYPKLSPIVKATAREFNLPYYEKKHFLAALWHHEKMLWKLGREF